MRLQHRGQTVLDAGVERRRGVVCGLDRGWLAQRHMVGERAAGIGLVRGYIPRRHRAANDGALGVGSVLRYGLHRGGGQRGCEGSIDPLHHVCRKSRIGQRGVDRELGAGDERDARDRQRQRGIQRELDGLERYVVGAKQQIARRRRRLPKNEIGVDRGHVAISASP